VDRSLQGLPVVIVRSGRNPHSVCLSLGLVLVSLYGMLFSTPSVSLDSGLDFGQRIMFAICSVTGSALILVGIYRKHLRSGLEIERGGQVLMATGSSVYVVVLCAVSSFSRSGLVTTIGVAICAGSVWRCIQITRDLRLLRKAGQ
jgi:hypothetical membrane protein